MLTPMTYRGPQALSDRGVLVVGGSATGVQLADEIQRSGRPVTLAVGEHVPAAPPLPGPRHLLVDGAQRGPRPALRRGRRPRPGPPRPFAPADRHPRSGSALDLNTLAAPGECASSGGSAVSPDGVAQFSGSLANVTKLADLKVNRLLDALDAWATRRWARRRGRPTAAVRPRRRRPPADPGRRPRRGEIGTIVWACGYRPDYSWLHLPVFDRRGRVVHDGGVVGGAPGVYLLGTPFLRRRRSSFISGADHDTRDLADHLHHWLDSRPPAPPGVRDPRQRRPGPGGAAGRPGSAVNQASLAIRRQ